MSLGSVCVLLAGSEAPPFAGMMDGGARRDTAASTDESALHAKDMALCELNGAKARGLWPGLA